MDHIELRLLAYFVEIARGGSITQAARRLAVSPPVVSAALRALEDRMGASLLRRTTRSQGLTVAGARVLAHAEAMVAAAGEALAGAEARTRILPGSVAVTMPMEFALAWAPGVLAEFARRYPQIDVHLHADDAPIDLRASDFDIALRAYYLEDATKGEAAIGDHAAMLPLQLLCRRDRRAALATEFRRDDGAVPFIGTRAEAERGSLLATNIRTRQQRRIRIASRVTANSHQLVRYLIEAGLGVGLLIAALQPANKMLVKVAPGWDFGAVGVRVLCRDRLPTRAARALAEHFELVLRRRPNRSPSPQAAG